MVSENLQDDSESDVGHFGNRVDLIGRQFPQHKYVRTRTEITHSWTHYRVPRDHFTTLIPLIDVNDPRDFLR